MVRGQSESVQPNIIYIYIYIFQIVVFLGKLLVAKKLEEYKRKFKKLRNFVLNSFFFLSINFFRFFFLFDMALFYL